MVVGRSWILKNHFVGTPKLSDLELVTEELGELQDGDIIFKAQFISVDPYQRAHVAAHRLNKPMIGSQVATVLESKDPNFPKGCTIITNIGWVETGKINPAKVAKGITLEGLFVNKAPEIGSLSPSHLLGACGMPGNTAYFGFLELCTPKEGETVVVNGAAGAVGSLVGQIAKIKGCKVIGYAGTDEKVNMLKEDLGFDLAYNYKKISAKDSLTEGTPEGVDCFFDNVGGSESSAIMEKMNAFGRISVCGAISIYNSKEPVLAPVIQATMITRELKMEGFYVTRWAKRWNEGIIQMAKWIQEGKIKARETVIKGFENTPKAFIGLFTGDNTGKMIVQV